jgi:DNA-directed RNA polymerase specialized sigma24 family protein/CheY-like chemotaxis protein
MSIAQSVEPHLPILRRYARALSGSQKSGDAYVRICLETLLAEPQRFDTDLPAKTALFQLFHRVWDAIGQEPAGEATSESRALKAADEHLRALTPKSRQVILLTSLEGFPVSEVASILDIDESEVESLLAEAEDELQKAMRARILIIEDEPVIALDIAALVEELGHSVTGVTATRDEAVAAARANAPDLVLADIQLADGSSGIDAAAEILRQLELPVIFITAFPERLLTGRRVEPTYLITKPFSPGSVRVAISQALFFRQNARRIAQ